MKRVALFTDKNVRNMMFFENAQKSLRAAGVEAVVYDEVLPVVLTEGTRLLIRNGDGGVCV